MGGFCDRCFLKQNKTVLPVFDQALFFHFADLDRKSAAVDLKVIGKLLAVKGDLKAVAPCLFCLHGQICGQLLARGLFGGDLHALMEQDRLGGKILHQIEDQTLVEGTVVGAGMENVRGIDQHDLARLVCNDADRHGADLGAGKRLAKDLSCLKLRENASVSVVVDLYDLRRAAKDDPDVFCRRALGKNRV